MSGSKNRKNTKATGTDYNKLKATDAEKWTAKINAVSAISFIMKTFSNLEAVLNAISAYFEVIKYAFPKVIVNRMTNVDKNLVKDAGSLNDDLELKTLKDKDEGQIVKWLKKVNTLFSAIAMIYAINSTDTTINQKLLQTRCKQFEKLMRISPAYIGHKPLFKYTNVREAFKTLGQTVAALPTLVRNATANLKPNK